MGKLAEVKTKPTTLSVEDFINNVADEQKRRQSRATQINAKGYKGKTQDMGYFTYRLWICNSEKPVGTGGGVVQSWLFAT